jgi:hypothetical protein
MSGIAMRTSRAISRRTATTAALACLLVLLSAAGRLPVAAERQGAVDRPHPAEIVSRADGLEGAPGEGASTRPSASADGRFVVFRTDAPNIGPPSEGRWNLMRRDLRTGRDAVVEADTVSFGSAVSANGRWVAYDASQENCFCHRRVYLRDMRTGSRRLVSRAGGVLGQGAADDAEEVSIAGDGRYVVAPGPKAGNSGSTYSATTRGPG